MDGNLVSTEKEELKHDPGKRHGTTTSHGREKFTLLVLNISKPYTELSKYTKLNKLLATYSFKRDMRSSKDRLPDPEVSTQVSGKRPPSLAQGWCSCWLLRSSPPASTLVDLLLVL